MRRYFWIQCKRLSRVLPGALLAAAILLGGLLGVYSLTMDREAAAEENQKVSIALVGQTDDPYLQLGLAAMEGFDSSWYTLQIHQMEEAQARQALDRGELAAYVQIPDTFMQEAMQGNILPLKFVSTTGAAGMVSLIKDELTAVISDVLVASQKGVYGMWNAVRENGLPLGSNMNDMALGYTEYVLARDKLYALEELGIGDALGLEGYLLCGLAVLFLLLCCLSFAGRLIRPELSLQRMLAAKGVAPWKQTLAELLAYWLMLMALTLTLLFLATAVSRGEFPLWQVLLRVTPVVLMGASVSYLLCALSTDLTGGMVLQFFTTLSLCFMGGCIFPAYLFPTGVQQVAACLPTGIARSLLAGSITGETMGLAPVYLAGYSLAFYLLATLVNSRRIKGVDL